jgi:radical SAM-linked protein
MIGLPFEREEDIEALVDMLWQVYRIGRRYRGRKHLAAGISIFVPKPFTPFQWEPFADRGEVREKVEFIKKKSPKQFKLRFHDYRQSIIEALLTRGGKSVGDVLLKAHGEGAQLDEWKEYFDWEKWERAFEKSGIDLERELGRRETEEELPWDFIEGVVTKEFLLRELEKARKEEWTPDCRIVGCHACGVCTPEQIRNLKNYPIPERIEFSVPPKPKREFPLKRKVALIFEKVGPAKYLSLLDLTRAFTRTFRRFGVPLRYSQGFNPHPRMNILFGLPVGVEGLGEIVEVELSDEGYNFDEFLKKSRDFLPEGLRFKRWVDVEPKGTISSSINEVTYRIKPYKDYKIDSLKNGGLSEHIKELIESEGEIVVTLKVTNGKMANIKEILKYLEVDLSSAEVVREELFK